MHDSSYNFHHRYFLFAFVKLKGATRFQFVNRRFPRQTCLGHRRVPLREGGSSIPKRCSTPPVNQRAGIHWKSIMVEYFLPGRHRCPGPPSFWWNPMYLCDYGLAHTETALQQHLVVETIHHISLVQSHRVFPPQQALCQHWRRSYLHYAIVTCPSSISPHWQRPPRSPRRTSLQELGTRFKLPSAHKLLEISPSLTHGRGNDLH